MASGLVVLACAVCLPFALEHGLGVAKFISAMAGVFAAPVCFLLGVREWARYGRQWRVIGAVAASGLATAIAWGVTLLVCWGRFP